MHISCFVTLAGVTFERAVFIALKYFKPFLTHVSFSDT